MKKQNILILVVILVVIVGISGCTTVDSLDPTAPQNKEYVGGNINSDNV